VAIEARNLVKEYNKRRVVDNVNLRVVPGEVVGLLGPNGAGKTTTFYMIVGLERPLSGGITINGQDVTRLPMHERARFGVSYLAQEPSIFRKLTVAENIMAILELRPGDKKEKEEKCRVLLEEFDLSRLRKQKGYMLSGGERRRVEIARALAMEPRFVLLDEPFTGVDPIAVADLQDIVKRLKEKELGVLITDHSVRETLAITDRAYIMYEGKILVSGEAEKIAANETARRFYLGDRFNM